MIIFLEQCGNDFERTVDKILMTKWCNDQALNNEYNQLTDDQMLISSSCQYPYDDGQLSLPSSYYSPSNQRMNTSGAYSQQFYQGPPENNIRVIA